MPKPLKLSIKEKAEAFDAIKEAVTILTNSHLSPKKERVFYRTVSAKIQAVEIELINRRGRSWLKRILSRR